MTSGVHTKMGARINELETHENIIYFVFILVNISLIIIYIDKVNKSHINDSADENAVNFKQEK